MQRGQSPPEGLAQEAGVVNCGATSNEPHIHMILNEGTPRPAARGMARMRIAATIVPETTGQGNLMRLREKWVGVTYLLMPLSFYSLGWRELVPTTQARTAPRPSLRRLLQAFSKQLRHRYIPSLHSVRNYVQLLRNSACVGCG